MDITDLYQDLILDHNNRPHNFGELVSATHKARGNNPLCGDDIEILLQLENEKIVKAHFKGKGCAISKASASLMTDEIVNKNITDVLELFEKFQNMLSSEQNTKYDLGKLCAFENVKKFPIRVKCATLAWHALKAALNNQKIEVTSE